MEKYNSKIRTKSFQARTTRERLYQIEILQNNFLNLIQHLQDQIQEEENKTKISDPTHYAYSPSAKSYRARCEKLQQSIADLNIKHEEINNRLKQLEKELVELQKQELSLQRKKA